MPILIVPWVESSDIFYFFPAEYEKVVDANFESIRRVQLDGEEFLAVFSSIDHVDTVAKKAKVHAYYGVDDETLLRYTHANNYDEEEVDSVQIKWGTEDVDAA